MRTGIHSADASIRIAFNLLYVAIISLTLSACAAEVNQETVARLQAVHKRVIVAQPVVELYRKNFNEDRVVGDTDKKAGVAAALTSAVNSELGNRGYTIVPASTATAEGNQITLYTEYAGSTRSAGGKAGQIGKDILSGLLTGGIYGPRYSINHAEVAIKLVDVKTQNVLWQNEYDQDCGPWDPYTTEMVSKAVKEVIPENFAD